MERRRKRLTYERVSDLIVFGVFSAAAAAASNYFVVVSSLQPRLRGK